MVNERCQTVLDRIDAVNRQDPNKTVWQGNSVPQALLYSQRMSCWLERLQPKASEIQRIAARGQHIARWTIPRNSYPPGRIGYLKWRSGLYEFHAGKVAAIMAEVGYQQSAIDSLSKIYRKRGLKKDPDVQLIEDVACLVFIEHYFLDFSDDYDEDKVVSVVRKTWKKMSAKARSAALEITLSEPALALIQKALSE